MQLQRNFIAPDQIRAELMRFYAKPVTRVSFELFMSVFAVVFFALFALQPTLNTMSRLVKEIEDKRVIETGLTKKIAALSTAQNEFITYQKRFEIFETAVHKNPTLETALFYMEYLVASEDVSLSGLRISEYPLSPDSTASAALDKTKPPEAPLTLRPHDVQITFQGDYANIVRFYRLIESIRPLFVVKNFTFTVRRGTQDENELFASSTVTLYGFEKPTIELDVKGKATPKPAEEESL